MQRFLLLFLLPVQIVMAQTPVTRDQMRLPQRVSREQLSAGYQVSTSNWVLRAGDTLQLGRGSMPDKRFAFVYESLTSFTSSANGQKNYLTSAMAGQRVFLKELFEYGTKRTGYTMIAKVGTGNIVNYWVEIENALESGELSMPTQFKGNSQAPGSSSGTGSVADELKKLKELLDAGALTQAEFDAQKKKLLNRDQP